MTYKFSFTSVPWKINNDSQAEKKFLNPIMLLQFFAFGWRIKDKYLIHLAPTERTCKYLLYAYIYAYKKARYISWGWVLIFFCLSLPSLNTCVLHLLLYFLSNDIFFVWNCEGDANSISIGCGTNIQDNSLVHVAKSNLSGKVLPTIIGDNVTVG